LSVGQKWVAKLRERDRPLPIWRQEKSPGRGLRQVSAALVLSFAIIGGCWVCNEPASAETLASLPAKSNVVPILHEVQIGEGTKEPQRFCVRSKLVVHVRRSFESEFVNAQVLRDFWIGFKDPVDGEGLPERVMGFVWQFIASKPSTLNLNGECLCSTKIRKIQIIVDRAIMYFRAISFLRSAEAEPVRHNANYWQLKRDGGPRTEIGGIGGGPCRARNADSKTSQYCSENCNDESGKRGNFILVSMDEVADWSEKRAYHGGAVFIGGVVLFVVLAGLYLRITW
jgi:hypothetical protein